VTYDSDVSQVLLPPMAMASSEPVAQTPVAAPAPPPEPETVMVVETTILRGSASPTARH
jgi:hypothetical protein